NPGGCRAARGRTSLATDVIPLRINKAARYTGPAISNPLKNAFVMNVQKRFTAPPSAVTERQVHPPCRPQHGAWSVVASFPTLGFALAGTGVLLGCAHQRHFEDAEMLGVCVDQCRVIPDLGLPALHRVERAFDPRRPPRRVL